jgi:hypothetical protein
MDARDLSHLLHRPLPHDLKDDSEELPSAEVQVNPLPDKYPEDEGKEK